MLLPIDFRKYPYLILDFAATNPDLTTLNLTNTVVFTDYVFGKLRAAGAVVGVGGYNEHRVIYRRSAHFEQKESRDGGPPCDGPREIHLGIDFWANAGTPVFAPLDGVVHSFQDNANFGDYGPTIILEHDTTNGELYSLYGHLTRSSLNGLYDGKPFLAGEKIAEIGPYPENGDWPPHLHFQLMTDMLGLRGDFPGVCSVSDREKFLAICPNPNTLLQIPGLQEIVVPVV
ncbi:peptidoglycan DD-metalloendopeptidase family protein [Spirosoma arcticum]